LKRLLKVLQYLFLGLGSFVLLVAFLALVVASVLWFRPGWILNNKSIAWTTHKLDGHGIHIDFENSDFRLRSMSFASKKLEWGFDRFCLTMSDGKTHACADKGKISARFVFRKLAIPEMHIDELSAHDIAVALDLRGPKSSEEAPKPFTLPDWLYKIDVGHLDLSPIRLSLQMEKKKLVADLSLEKQVKDPWIVVDVKRFEMGGENKFVLQAANVRLRLEQRAVAFEAQAKAFIQQVGHIDANVASTWKFPEGLQKASFDVGFRDMKSPTHANFAGSFANEHLRGRLTGAYYLRNASVLDRIEVANCTLSGGLDAAHFVCQPVLKIDPARKKEWAASWKRFQGPRSIAAEIRLDLNKEANNDYRAKLAATTRPVNAKLYDFKFKANLESSYKDYSKKGYRAIEGTSSFALRVPHFEPLAELLNSTGLVLVPAPANTLSGLVYAQSDEARIHDGQLYVPIKIGTNLVSVDQRLKTQGLVEIGGKLEKARFQACLNSFQLDIQDSLLQMPRFRVTNPPRFFGDSRFDKPVTKLKLLQTQAEKKKKLAKSGCPEPFINVTTRKPVRIVTHHLPTPLPVSFEYVAGGKTHLLKDRINVDIDNYEAELLRRKVEVENLNIAIGKNDTMVNGRLSMNYPQYKVLLDIRGPTDRLNFALSSLPPLPQQDIVSLILYGRPTSALSENQMGSVNDMSAAMADAALGLFSLYVFASTPVQSVGYDPQSRSVVAAVGLGGDYTLNVGGGAEGLSEVGITKELGHNWRVTTTFDDPTQQNLNNLQALLEWYKFF
jgi:hypothetical protein